MCPAGTFKPSLGSEACGPCPSRSRSAAGSIAVAACECDAGNTGPGGGPCAPCAAGKYKPAAGDLNCTNCPPGAAADSRNRTCLCHDANADFSASAARCLCRPGLVARADGKCGGYPAGADAVYSPAVGAATATAATHTPAALMEEGAASGALEKGSAVSRDEGGWVWCWFMV